MKIQIKKTGETLEFTNLKEAAAHLFKQDPIRKSAFRNFYALQNQGEIEVLDGEVIKDTEGAKVEFRLNAESITGLSEYIEKRITELLPVEHHLVIQTEEAETKITDKYHKELPTLIKVLAAGCHAMLIGPAGSGKTTACDQAAKALSRPFYCISVGMQTSKTDFLGYMDATGKYVKTNFRKCYEEGGIFLIDEIDSGNAGILTIVNSALSNGVCAFPDQMVNRHKDFICCASANTYGKGADRMYVGRNQLDAATLDRFVKMVFDYDEQFEMNLATNKDWCNKVQALRKRASEKQMRVIVSPRMTFFGCQLLAAGVKEKEVMEMTLLSGLSKDERNLILN